MRFKFGVILGLILGGGAAFYADRDPQLGPVIDQIIEQNWPQESEYTPDRGSDIPNPTLPLVSGALAQERLERLNVTDCFVRNTEYETTPPSWMVRPALEALGDSRRPNYPPPNLVDYPGLVKLETIRSTSGTNREHCAGARIAENWIVTAAHCVLAGPTGVKPTDMVAVAPRVDVYQPDTPIAPVKAAFCHAAYNHQSNKFDDDITLLYVGDMETLQGIDIVDYDTTTDTLEQDRFMQTRIAGWGKNGGNRFLQGGRVNLTNIGQTLMISENIGPIGPCVGDSGGPLYVTASGANPVVGGILQSVTRASCPADNNAFFLRLQSYAPWIERIIANCEIDGELVC